MAEASGLPLLLASGGGTSAVSLADLRASTSSPGARVWLCPESSGVCSWCWAGSFCLHAPDAQRSAVEPWVKLASHAPRRPAPAAVEFAVVLIRFSSAETSFYSSTRDYSFAGRPPGSHTLGQLLALPLASLALWVPGACFLVRAAS